MLSLFDLAFHYIERFYDEEPSTEEKRQIIEEFEDLFFYGWSMGDINKVIKRFIERNPGQKPSSVSESFEREYRGEDNLLTPGKYYYHNQLRLTPGPPVMHLDINLGEITTIEEPYFLEMRASYTINDLVDYYIKQFDVKAGPDERKRLVGTFKYLLKTVDVEKLLFMVDVAINTVYSEDMDRNGFNPFKLIDFRTNAEKQLGEKRTEHMLDGGEKIVPRKRVLSLRSGSPV